MKLNQAPLNCTLTISGIADDEAELEMLRHGIHIHDQVILKNKSFGKGPLIFEFDQAVISIPFALAAKIEIVASQADD